MKKALMALFAGILSAALVLPVAANPNDSPGHSQFGKCTALTNGQGSKYHANAFRDFDDLDGDGDFNDDGDDATDDYAEAIAYCSDFLSDPGNHPSSNGNGNGRGNGNDGG